MSATGIEKTSLPRQDRKPHEVPKSSALERSEVIVYPSGRIEVRIGIDVESTVSTFNELAVKEQFRALADKLCKEHPAISTDKGIFGGMPHINNVRLSVGDVLAKLYVYGSVQSILDIYAPDISEEQIKEAIAYAQDFLETACDPRQSSQIDG